MGQCTTEETGGTHTKSGNQNHVSKSRGDGIRDGGVAWLSTAGVRWDTTDRGPLSRPGPRQELMRRTC